MEADETRDDGATGHRLTQGAPGTRSGGLTRVELVEMGYRDVSTLCQGTGWLGTPVTLWLCPGVATAPWGDLTIMVADLVTGTRSEPDRYAPVGHVFMVAGMPHRALRVGATAGTSHDTLDGAVYWARRPRR